MKKSSVTTEQRAQQRVVLSALVAVIVFVGVFFVVNRPLTVAGWLNGEPVHLFEVEGGARVRFGIDDTGLSELDIQSVAAGIAQRGYHFSRDVAFAVEGRDIIVELGGATASDAKAFTEVNEQGRTLRLQLVVNDTDAMNKASTLLKGYLPALDLGVEVAADRWFGPLGEEYHDVYLVGPSQESLEQVFNLLKTEHDWHIPAGTEIAYELMPADFSREPNAEPRWRSYLLSREHAFSPLITEAHVYFSEYTLQPELLVEFDRDGGRRFAELTTQFVGHKIAIRLDDDIVSAPTVQAAITGGTMSLSMGSAAPEEADKLVVQLREGQVPASVVVQSIEEVEATSSILVIARLMLALVAAFLAFAASLFVAPRIRLARRPSDEAMVEESTKGSATRALVIATMITGAGCVLVVLAAMIPLHGFDVHDLDTFAMDDHRGAAFPLVAMTMLGLAPYVSASVLVELVALCFPSTRRRRLSGFSGRAPLEKAAVALSIPLALAQSYVVVIWLEGIGRGYPPGEILVKFPGWAFRLTAMATLTGGYLAMLAIARQISRAGVGDGIAVFLSIGTLISLWPSLASFDPEVFQSVAIMTGTTVVLLVLRLLTSERTPRVLRVPTSGIIPLEWATILAATLSIITSLVLVPDDLFILTNPTTALGTYCVATVVFSPLLSLLFTRKMGLGFGDRLRTALASTLALLGLLAACYYNESTIGITGCLGVCVGTAVVMDLVCEFNARRRRGDWTAVWPLQRANISDSVLSDLRSQGVECFARGANLRTLLQFFAPFVPITVFVPKREHDLATTIIEHHLRHLHEDKNAPGL